MAEVIVQEESLVTVADAIREKTGGTDALVFPTGFAEAIEAIQAGGGGGSVDEIIDRTISECDSNSVQTVGNYAFQNCKSLNTVNFPVATKIGDYAFNGCSSLTTANFPAVTSISDYAFNGCSSLTTANFPVATSINAYAFQNCQSLNTVNFPVATKIGNYAFQNCPSLITVDLPAVTSIGSAAFRYCYDLTAVILRKESKVTLSNINAFNDCCHILGTTFGTYNPDSLTDGYIYVPSALVATYQADSKWSTYSTQFRAIEDYTVDGTITGALDETKI